MWDYLNILRLKIKAIRAEVMVNEEGSEKWRIGGGHEKYLPYFRIDLGSKGVRFTTVFDWTERFYLDVMPNAPEAVKSVLMAKVEELSNRPNVKTYIVSRNGQAVREVVGLYKELYYFGKEAIRDYEKEAKK